MINTFKMYHDLSQTIDPPAAEKIIEIIAAVYEELRDMVTKKEFNELKVEVRGLARAQKKTELRIAELAEAQKRTEDRLSRLEMVVAELAEAQKRTEDRLSRLEMVVAELAEAQKRTEARVDSLVRAQEETTRQIAELTRAQADTNRQLGGLSMTVGYTLENEAYKALPALLAKDFSIAIVDRLKRGYLVDNAGRAVEVNILGAATRDDQKLTIIGESKAQLSKNNIDRFINRKLEPLQGVADNIFPILITHMISAPDVEEYAKERGIALYYSYEF